MNGKSCFFIGHRETSEAIYPALYAVVEQHILEYGVTEFIVGHYGGFDSTFYPPGMESVPRKVAIVRANRYVVDHVDYLIAPMRGTLLAMLKSYWSMQERKILFLFLQFQ